MSFDLSVLVDRFDAHIQAAWVNRLKENGVDCKFPVGFDLANAQSSSEPIVCTVGPPLVKSSCPATPIELLSIESQPTDPDEVANILTGRDAQFCTFRDFLTLRLRG
jgi:hypothetical protein